MFRFARACARIASCQSAEECRIEGAAAARDLFDADASWLALVEEDQLVIRASSGLRHSDMDRTWRMPMGTGIAGVVATDGKARIIRDYRRDSRREDCIKQIVDAEGFRSAVMVPFVDSDSVFGVLTVANYLPDQFSEVELTLAKDVGVAMGQLLSALEAKSVESVSRARAEDLLEQHRSGLVLLSRMTGDTTADGLDWSRALERLASWLDGAVAVRNGLGQPIGSAGLREGPTARFAFPGGPQDDVALYATAERPLTEAQVEVCSAAAGILALELARERSRQQAEIRLFAGIFDELIDGEVRDEQQVTTRAAIGGIDLYVPRTVLCMSVEPATKDDRSLPLPVIRGVERYLAAHCKGAAATVRDGRLVVFIPSPAAGSTSRRELWQATLGKIRSYVGAPRIAIGIGSDCRRLSDYPRAFRQASIAVEHLERNAGEGVALIEDLGLYGVLAQSTTQSALDELLTRTIGPLLEADNDGSSEYIRTLRAYFQHDRHLQPAANELYVHVNTLRYRLKRIQEILGTDLHSADDRFTLELAIRVVDSGAVALPAELDGITENPPPAPVPALAASESGRLAASTQPAV